MPRTIGPYRVRTLTNPETGENNFVVYNSSQGLGMFATGGDVHTLSGSEHDRASAFELRNRLNKEYKSANGQETSEVGTEENDETEG